MRTFGIVATCVLVVIALFFGCVGISALAQNIAYVDALKQVFGAYEKVKETVPEETQEEIVQTIARIFVR